MRASAHNICLILGALSKNRRARCIMAHLVVYRERVAIGPIHKDKVVEWIWVGWCRCGGAKAQMKRRVMGEPYGKIMEQVEQQTVTSSQKQVTIQPFNSLAEALASLKRGLEGSKCGLGAESWTS